MKTQKKHLSQAGYSLLEFFIAITIGLLLLAGVLQVYLQSKSSFHLESGYTQLQENGRFIEEYIVRIVRMAGYRSIPTTGSQFPTMSSVYPAATPYISGTYGNGPNGSDTLTVRYQGSGDGAGNPDGSVVDCLNVPVDSNTTVTNIFSLNTSNQLQCQALNANAPTPNDTQVLISGVENFHVLFGEDITGDASADRFVNANYAFLTWSNMVSVRLSLLFRSDNQVGPFTQQPTFYMLGTSYTPASADNFLRNQLNFTVVLRNLV